MYISSHLHDTYGYPIHSALLSGGLPIYPGKQSQIALLLITLHWLFGSQGVDKHELTDSSYFREGVSTFEEQMIRIYK